MKKSLECIELNSCLYSIIPFYLRGDGMVWMYVFIVITSLYYAYMGKGNKEEKKIEQQQKEMSFYNHHRAYLQMKEQQEKEVKVLDKSKLL